MTTTSWSLVPGDAGNLDAGPYGEPAAVTLKHDGSICDCNEAAEALFGIAASLSDASHADIAGFYLKLALYLEPDFDLGRIVLADRFEALEKYADAVEIYDSVAKDSPYKTAAAIQAGKVDAYFADAPPVLANGGAARHRPEGAKDVREVHRELGRQLEVVRLSRVRQKEGRVVPAAVALLRGHKPVRHLPDVIEV